MTITRGIQINNTFTENSGELYSCHVSKERERESGSLRFTQKGGRGATLILSLLPHFKLESKYRLSQKGPLKVT